jgi:NADH dehydrogenase
MATSGELSVVTGALGYTGRYIARALFERGARVRTLTAHPSQPNPFGERLEIAPMDFGSPDILAQCLDGASTFYNTYWIRFPYRGATFKTAVENTRTLLRAARKSGVRRIVHISITGAAEDSPLPYFRGKGIVEREIAQSGLAYLILRPTLIFGVEDVLVNNIAWLLRRFPLFTIPGRGDYRVQPVFVADLAALAEVARPRPTTESSMPSDRRFTLSGISCAYSPARSAAPRFWFPSRRAQRCSSRVSSGMRSAT